MKKILLFVILLSLNGLLFAGQGSWLYRSPLKEVQARNYKLFDRSRTGMDAMDVERYTGYVFLDYTRQEQSDMSLSQNFWRVKLNYSYVSGGLPQTGFVEISFEDGNYTYSDFKEVPCDLSEKGFSVRVTSLEASYLDNGNWTAVSDIYTDTHIPDDIDFRLELRSERLFDLAPASDKTFLTADATDYEIKWNYTEGAEEYDLEWVHIDAESLESDQLAEVFANSTLLNAGGYAFPFAMKEPARVRVWGTRYFLDKTYTQGTIYFRVRAVGRFAENGQTLDQVRPAEWNYFNTASPGTIDLNDITRIAVGSSGDFETEKNWLYGVSFAEGGKSVSSVTIFDGSNRGRQNLVYNTSDDVTLISESKYDFEGRQVISVIPAPIHGRNLGYRTNFNLVSANVPFGEEHFDIDNPQPMSGEVSGESGAAQYFSANNRFTDDLFRAAIPDANGYVYSQTVYRNDGTGRIERVGGIGEEFKVNGSHAVETFYGSPLLFELKRLFGPNVSNDLNGYRKEMVKDANDQYSVTYYDKRGNVIATGLTGEAPVNLIALDGIPAAQQVTTSLNNNNNQVDPYTLVSEHTFLNAIAGNTITLTYDLTGAVVELEAQPVTIGDETITFGELCSSCRYVLDIVVKDQNGLPVENGHIEEFLYPEIGCGDPQTYGQKVMNVTLPAIGEYRIIKTLRVDVDAMYAAFEAGLTSLPSLSLETFVTDYAANTDLSACFENCVDYCQFNAVRQTALGHDMTVAVVKEELLNNPTSTISQEVIAYYQACAAETCNGEAELNADLEFEMPDSSSQSMCKMLRQQMKQQISPGGVFYTDAAFWANVPDNYLIVTEGIAYDKEDIRTQADIWNDEIAESVLFYHREYCHLATCDAWEATQLYSMKLAQKLVQNGWNAGSALFTEPYHTDVAGHSEDPFIASVFNGTNSTALQGLIASRNYTLCDGTALNGVSLVSYAGQQADCLADASLDNSDPADDITGNEINELKINLFLGTYNQIKQELTEAYKASLEPECAYYQDQHVVFRGEMNAQSIQNQINLALFEIAASTDCIELSWKNTLYWLYQLDEDCLSDLNVSISYDYNLNEYQTNFTENDLVMAYNGNTINTLPELLYSYTRKTCPQNMYGWFFDPGTGNPGKTEYDGVKQLLSACYPGDLPFELSPTPELLSTEELDFSLTEEEATAAAQYICDLAMQQFSQESGELTSLGTKYEVFINNMLISEDIYGTVHIEQVLNASMNTNQLKFYLSLAKYANTHCTYHSGFEQNPLFDAGKLTSVIPYVLFNVQIWDERYVFQVDYTNPDGLSDIVDNQHVNKICATNYSNYDFSELVIPLPDYQADCIASETAQATADATLLYYEMLDDLRNAFAEKVTQCIGLAQEDFNMTYYLKEHQYTLYYYDLANNLVQTVPPQGVHPLTTQTEIDNAVFPPHELETRYQYNGLNTLLAQFTPDGGKTRFHLDKLYRVRFSQNARQLLEGKASYSKYDALGRVIEAGEFALLGDALDDLALTEIENNAFPGANRQLDFTKTYYEEAFPNDFDNSIAGTFTGGQENLRNAIGAIEHRQAEYTIGTTVTANAGTVHKTVISYSYDPHKNVKQVVNTNYDLQGLGQHNTTTEYGYDLISGNVNEVIYQRGKIDQYRHQYHYDANNRLVRAFTSDNGGLTRELDAKYFYYLHGALARTEIGHDKVQGMDYAYNLQGWLKGMNSATLERMRDLGNDALGGLNENFGQDVTGFQLGYFATDYAPIGNVSAFANTAELQLKNQHTDNVNKANLFNGNISHMISAITKTDETLLDILGNNYRYDQLQRIKAMDVYFDEDLISQNAFTTATDLYRRSGSQGAYRERYQFDKNGNLLRLSRNGSGRDGVGNTVALAMDNFGYNYYEHRLTSDITASPINSNRLASVDDAVSGDGYSTDIESGQTTNNYQYDATGQLTQDLDEEIEEIQWTVTGKVKFIKFTGTSVKKDLRFLYDPMDRRIAKIIYNNNDKSDITYTYYTHDAQGNVMATYERKVQLTPSGDLNHHVYSDVLTLNDHHLYGSQRLGVENQKQLVVTALQRKSVTETSNLEEGMSHSWTNVTQPVFDYTKRVAGDKSYEISNHLGNVLNVVTDRKLPYDEGNNGTVDYYTADVVSYADYFPGGMLMPGRHGSVSDYDFGFNGERKDDEIKGEGNSYDYGNRMYDTRLVQFISLDAYASKYPGISPYVFAANNPIMNKDVGGDSVLFYSSSGAYLGYSNDNYRYKGKNLLVIIDDNSVAAFREQYDLKRNAKVPEGKTPQIYRDALVAGLEAMGTSFDVTSFVSFYDQFKDKKYDDGQAVPLEGAEKNIGVEWSTGLKFDKSNPNDKNGSIAVDFSRQPYSDNNKESVTVSPNNAGLGGFHTHALFGNPSPSKDPDHINADNKERGAWQIVQGNGMLTLYRDNAPYDIGKREIIEISIHTTGPYTKNQPGQ